MTNDELAAHLNDDKGIAISGEAQKTRLRNIGYFHGYKGCRFRSGQPDARFKYNAFDQLLGVYDFDSRLKALFYSPVMAIETAFRNRVIECAVKEAGSDSFQKIYLSVMDDYKRFAAEKSGRKSREALGRRHEMRDRLYKAQTDAYARGNRIATHFLSQNREMPLWAIFEFLSLGDLGYFIRCLNMACRRAISANLGLDAGVNPEFMLPADLVFATRDIRNAIAHNNIIYDARFRTGKVNRRIVTAISRSTGIVDICFDTVTDYLLLIVYQLCLVETSGTELIEIINKFNQLVDILKDSVPLAVFGSIIHPDNRAKIRMLGDFVAKNG